MGIVKEYYYKRIAEDEKVESCSEEALAKLTSDDCNKLFEALNEAEKDPYFQMYQRLHDVLSLFTCEECTWKLMDFIVYGK